MKLWLLTLCSVGLLAATTLRSADDLAPLSDEFNYGPTITNWSRIFQVEGWGNNALQQCEINTVSPGRLLMVPYSSSWYEEYRGELTFKNVSGDFVITTDIEPTSRSGSGAPQSQYSLAGIMVRTPRSMTSPAQWTPNGQNYVFLSLGAASSPGNYQFEVKTTVNSISTLDITDNGPSRAKIQVARLGAHLIALRRNQGGVWQVHRRYHRPDMPAQLQAGLTVYTDWALCERVGVENQNTRVLTNGAPLIGGSTVTGANPDLMAAFDYVRYQRPQIPPQLVGANFSNPSSVSDAQLLAFLGANADVPHLPPAQLAGAGQPGAEGFPLRVQAAAGLACILQVSTNLTEWNDLQNFPGIGQEEVINDTSATAIGLRFYRVVVTP